MGNFIHTTLLGDPVVKDALCCQVERESKWTNKSSNVVECRDMFNQIAEIYQHQKTPTTWKLHAELNYPK